MIASRAQTRAQAAQPETSAGTSVFSLHSSSPFFSRLASLSHSSRVETSLARHQRRPRDPSLSFSPVLSRSTLEQLSSRESYASEPAFNARALTLQRISLSLSGVPLRVSWSGEPLSLASIFFCRTSGHFPLSVSSDLLFSSTQTHSFPLSLPTHTHTP